MHKNIAAALITGAVFVTSAAFVKLMLLADEHIAGGGLAIWATGTMIVVFFWIREQIGKPDKPRRIK